MNDRFRRGRGWTRHLVGPWGRRALLLGGLLLVTLLVALYLSPNPRSFALNAVSRSVSLDFVGTGMNAWSLPEVLVCYRRGERAGSAVPPDAAAAAECDPRLYESRRFAATEMVWSDGAAVTVTRPGPGDDLEIFVRDPGAVPTRLEGRELRPGSRLLLSGARWLGGGNLTFSANVVLGQLPGPGAQQNLIEGSFEVREAMPTQSRPVPVMAGTLFPGDQLRVVADTPGREAITGFGFIEPGDEAEPGFRFVLYTPPRQSQLQIDRFGAETILIGPTWIDRALHDSIFVAVTTAGAFVGAAAGLVSTVYGAFGPFGRRRRPLIGERWRERRASRSPAARPPAS